MTSRSSRELVQYIRGLIDQVGSHGALAAALNVNSTCISRALVGNFYSTLLDALHMRQDVQSGRYVQSREPDISAAVESQRDREVSALRTQIAGQRAKIDALESQLTALRRSNHSLRGALTAASARRATVEVAA